MLVSRTPKLSCCLICFVNISRSFNFPGFAIIMFVARALLVFVVARLVR